MSARYVASRFSLLAGPPRRASSVLGDHAVARERSLRQCSDLERCASAALRERDFGPATERLLDLVAESDLLALVAPSGRLPRDFAQRCLDRARSRRAALQIEGEALRAGAQLVARRVAAPSPAVVARLARLAASYPGEAEEGLAPGEIALPGTPWVVDRRGRARCRSEVPGSHILVAAPLVSGRNALRVPRSRSAEPAHLLRLGRALGAVRAAWPEAAEEIGARTRLIVPLEEPGLVSYSHLHRPGVTFLNLKGKRLVDLADDLVHETAHHRLHAIERETPLFRPEASGEDAPRYFSPWRRALRPVRGIYHACYTFAFRAELFRRIVRTARSAGGRVGPMRVGEPLARWLREEARSERRHLRRGLADLDDAARKGLLTAAGRRLLRRV